MINSRIHQPVFKKTILLTSNVNSLDDSFIIYEKVFDERLENNKNCTLKIDERTFYCRIDEDFYASNGYCFISNIETYEEAKSEYINQIRRYLEEKESEASDLYKKTEQNILRYKKRLTQL